VTTSQQLRGHAEQFFYSSLVRTVRLRNLIPGRRAMTPSFLLVGAQRSGTTSLFKYLTRHPDYRAPIRKEIHYFSLHYSRGPEWYKAHFPGVDDAPSFTGDATPYYLYHPLAAQRAHELLPDAKIVVLLRDPVSRARSHYQHEVAKGHERLSFRDAIDAEPERLRGEVERITNSPDATSFAHQHYSYMARGRYLDQLLVWEEAFGADNVLTLTSESMFADPAAAVNTVTEFLDVASFDLHDAKAYNSYEKAKAADSFLDELAERFAEDNQRLYDHLGRDLGWRKPAGT